MITINEWQILSYIYIVIKLYNLKQKKILSMKLLLFVKLLFFNNSLPGYYIRMI